MTRRILLYLKLIFAANLIVTMTEKQHFNDEQETKHLFSNVGYFNPFKKEIYLINTFKNTTSGSIQGHKKAFHHEN